MCLNEQRCHATNCVSLSTSSVESRWYLGICKHFCCMCLNQTLLKLGCGVGLSLKLSLGSLPWFLGQLQTGLQGWHHLQEGNDDHALQHSLCIICCVDTKQPYARMCVTGKSKKSPAVRYLLSAFSSNDNWLVWLISSIEHKHQLVRFGFRQDHITAQLTFGCPIPMQAKFDRTPCVCWQILVAFWQHDQLTWAFCSFSVD